MSQPDRLTIEELNYCVENPEDHGMGKLSTVAAALLDTMRENERLREALTIIRQNTFDIGGATEKDNFLCALADKALRNKDSGHG